jgi:hypothetical protein
MVQRPAAIHGRHAPNDDLAIVSAFRLAALTLFIGGLWSVQ